jgi:transposase
VGHHQPLRRARRCLGPGDRRPLARHRAEEFRRSLSLIERSLPEQLSVDVVLDNSATHETPSIQRWLQRHARFTLHFTPTYSSWLNLVERWFAELTTKSIKRGTHRSVRDLVASIRTWTENRNEDPRPYVWHKPPTRSSTASPPTPANQRLR